MANGMFVQFGQYIIHDLSGAPTQNGKQALLTLRGVGCNEKRK